MNDTTRNRTIRATDRRPRPFRSALAILALLTIALAPAPSRADAEEPAADTAADTTVVATRAALASARALADEKRFDDAAAALRPALAADPGNLDARSLLARVLAWGRRYDESMAEYRTILGAHPDDAFDRAGYARVLAWSGRSERALPEFRRAIASDSTNLETRVGYARALSWTGDLAGAAAEYRRILRANRGYGDAWLGYATVARWRGAPTASDRFLERAAARGADADGVTEERNADRTALAPALGGGWTTAHERQYVAGPDFTIETTGPYALGRATLGRAVQVAVRGARLLQFERNGSSAPADTALNYDLASTLLRADASFLRGYPLQVAAGVESRTFGARSARVLYPLRGDDRFVGWSGRVWGFAGRFTPSLGVHRDYLAIKSITGPREIRAGDQTVTDAGLDWQWNGRGTIGASFAKGLYSDDNERTSLAGLVRYRVRARVPFVTLDYGAGYTDFLRTSRSYFTPLASVRHAAGALLSGYSDRAALDYGIRYQFAAVLSSNFDDIFTNTVSAYLNGTALGSLPLGIEGSWSRDNNAYETWSLGISASARW
ncbi:MAG: tetratricopeptide repeat protein [Hyphomicrobiales bacterium]